MGFYIRKSFRAGPVRFNLSKGGLGLSAGVEGARVGTGPRGRYVHAGRHGLYYRKYQSSGNRKSASKTREEGGGGTLLLILLAIGAGLWFIFWLLNHPWILGAGVFVALSIVAGQWWLRKRQANRLGAYKESLDQIFVAGDAPPAKARMDGLHRQREQLSRNARCVKRLRSIEADVYQAVLDMVLDDGHVTDEEAARIQAAESVLGLDPSIRLQVKKEIFSAAYIEAIEDRKITDEEMQHLRNLCSGLCIPESDVEGDMQVVADIAAAQTLELPFEPLSRDRLCVNMQKSEDAYYQCSAQVLTRRKSRTSDSGYQYTVKRSGPLVLTQKRLFVVDEGTTSIPYKDIADVEYDIDLGLITISKSTSSRPVFVKTKSPSYTARAIDLLSSAALSQVI
ncbi:MAG: DUF4236 domain-containing protein [Candidatus Pacebacteria bacterium]|nr:DUF4236 domain-containing protein [Candidatus Paceibacterota bacterium]